MYMVPTWGHQLHEQEDAATQEEGGGHGISPGQVLQKQPGQYVRRDFNHCRKEAVHIDVPVQVRGIKGEAEVAHGYGHPETVQKKAGGAESRGRLPTWTFQVQLLQESLNYLYRAADLTPSLTSYNER